MNIFFLQLLNLKKRVVSFPSRFNFISDDFEYSVSKENNYWRNLYILSTITNPIIPYLCEIFVLLLVSTFS